jgi:dihydrofolate reductase
MKVLLLASLTVDGLIGRHNLHLANWSSAEDKQFFVKTTKKAGTIIMGSNTFDTIGKPLPGRKTILYAKEPEKYVYDNVETTSEDPKLLIKRLNLQGVKTVVICGGASIYNYFMSSGVVDELYLTIEPVIFGEGLRLFSSELNINLTLISVKKINQNTILVHYKVNK